MVWREGDDEEGVLTYQQLSTSVRKISRVIQKVTSSSSSPFSRSPSPSPPPGRTRPPAYLFTSLPNHRRRASRLRQGWETSHIGRWMIGMIMPCSKSSKINTFATVIIFWKTSHPGQCHHKCSPHCHHQDVHHLPHHQNIKHHHHHKHAQCSSYAIIHNQL